jgi:D-threo-aldose 1-dehydrogenase
VTTRKLRAGSGTLDVTLLGFGGAPLGNLYTAISDDEAQATLDAAWDAGISTYDPFD